MELPVRIDPAQPMSGNLTVDGAWGADGLNLSHWPGNTTPPDLVHELSTGSALYFAELGDAERQRRAQGAGAIINNHYDTDGVLALFATRFPTQALPFREALLEAAAAGDYFTAPNERALALDALITRFVDPAYSRAARALAAKPDAERYTKLANQLLAELPDLLAAEALPMEELWLPVVERYRSDRAQLESALRQEQPVRDLCVFTAMSPWSSDGPGRHALFEATECDRVLVMAPTDQGGVSARLILSTRSWFEPICKQRMARPNLNQLADKLNQLDPTPASPLAWRAQKITGASPELWFGTAELDSFAEHSTALRPSALTPVAIRQAVEASLENRAVTPTDRSPEPT